MPKKEVITGTTEWEGLFFGECASQLDSHVVFGTTVRQLKSQKRLKGVFPLILSVSAVLGNIKRTPDGMRKVTRVSIKECDYGKEYQGIQKEIVDYYLGDTHPKDHEGVTKKHLQVGNALIS